MIPGETVLNVQVRTRFQVPNPFPPKEGRRVELHKTSCCTRRNRPTSGMTVDGCVEYGRQQGVPDSAERGTYAIIFYTNSFIYDSCLKFYSPPCLAWAI